MKNLGRVSHDRDITTVEYLDYRLRDYLPKSDMTIPIDNIATIDMLPVEKDFVKKIDFPDDLVHEADLEPYALTVDLDKHLQDLENPHAITKEHVDLGNVDNTSDSEKPISQETQNALDNKLDKGSETTVYSLSLSDAVIRRVSDSGNLNPSSITIKSKRNKGISIDESALGYFLIYEISKGAMSVDEFTKLAAEGWVDDNGTYVLSNVELPHVLRYRSESAEDEVAYKISGNNIDAIRVEWYEYEDVSRPRAEELIYIIQEDFVKPQELSNHITNPDIHITKEERDRWESKPSNLDTITNQQTNTQVKLWIGTETEYEAIGTKDMDTLYLKI